MIRKVLCWLFGHKPKWRRLNGTTVECCARCGHVYRLGDWRDLDDL